MTDNNYKTPKVYTLSGDPDSLKLDIQKILDDEAIKSNLEDYVINHVSISQSSYGDHFIDVTLIITFKAK